MATVFEGHQLAVRRRCFARLLAYTEARARKHLAELQAEKK